MVPAVTWVSETEPRSSGSRDGSTGCSSGGCWSDESVPGPVGFEAGARKRVHAELRAGGVTRVRTLPMRAEHEIMRMRCVSLKEQVARYELERKARLGRSRDKERQRWVVRKDRLSTAEAGAELLGVRKTARLNEEVWTTTLAEVSGDLGEQDNALAQMESAAAEDEWDGPFESFSRELSP